MGYFDLGSHSRSVVTSSSDAQLWFDRGLIWLYAYHHEEALACFKRALAADPDCAMAHWGIAYAVGPNYNKPWASFEVEEKAATVACSQASVAAAAALADRQNPADRALIEALAKRCPSDPVEDFAPWNDGFAAAMRDVRHAYPADLDIAALTAEAMMNRTPWQLWDLPNGRPAEGADTIEALTVLEAAIARPGGWDHPGLLHMYIHLMEMSPNPERALRHGDCLASLVPDAGHLIHMGSHIDVLCGDYTRVVERNARAIEADHRWVAREGAENFYSVYRCHNYHFKIYGAMFLAQSAPALETADELAASLTEPLLRPMADWFEAFVPMKQHVLIRFGMWQEILEQALPEDEELYAMTTALMRYARTVALANLGEIARAEAERDAFLEAKAAVPESRMLFNNTCIDILGIAKAMMLGELAYHSGDFELGFDHLRHAVHLEDTLPYDEPWGWMQPVRHALAALLLVQDRVEEAEAVYREDLGLGGQLPRAQMHPDNLWSLRGLMDCLDRRGAAEAPEGRLVQQRLNLAAARADLSVGVSCFCAARSR